MAVIAPVIRFIALGPRLVRVFMDSTIKYMPAPTANAAIPKVKSAVDIA